MPWRWRVWGHCGGFERQLMFGCGCADRAWGGAAPQGAVGVRFVVGATGLDRGRTLCFINSHLNAHVHNVKRRQEDYETYVSHTCIWHRR
jgi:hypothetical protein